MQASNGMRRNTAKVCAASVLGLLCLGLHVLGAASDPLADLKAAAVALDAKNYAAAAASLGPGVDGLAKRLPKLADYAAWLTASAQFGLKNYSAVPATLDPVWKQTPPSPLAAKAYLLAAQALIQNGTGKSARRPERHRPAAQEL